MLLVYIVLMVCTMTPVIAMQAGADASVLVWLVFACFLLVYGRLKNLPE